MGPRALWITSSPSVGLSPRITSLFSSENSQTPRVRLPGTWASCFISVLRGVSSSATLICLSTGLTRSLRENRPQISGSHLHTCVPYIYLRTVHWEPTGCIALVIQLGQEGVKGSPASKAAPLGGRLLSAVNSSLKWRATCHKSKTKLKINSCFLII